MSFISDIAKFLPVEWLANTMIDMAQKIIDKQVAGEKLGSREIKVVRSAYFEAKNWLTELVDQTTTTIDNKALDEFIKLCEDTAAEGNFSLAP